ncbi:MAG: hypothetical protein AAGK14_01410 [Verrucomicrobiota bacterium]
MDGFQIALELKPHLNGPSTSRVFLRNRSAEPLTLLHPDTLVRVGDGAEPRFRRALELSAEGVSPEVAPGPFTRFAALPVGPREAIILQPGEVRRFERGVPAGLVTLQRLAPNRVEVLERAFPAGAKLVARYRGGRESYLGVPLWRGEVASPVRALPADPGPSPTAPIAFELRTLNQAGERGNDFRVVLTLTNRGATTVYARLVPAADGRPLWTLHDDPKGTHTAPRPGKFPRLEHHVILEPGQSRTWRLRPQDWLDLDQPGDYELLLQARLQWQAAANWRVASMLSMLPAEELRAMPLELRHHFSRPEFGGGLDR